MREIHVVVVEHNIVVAIERVADAPPDLPVPPTPLAVGTELARNNLANGCIDGRD